MSAERADIVIVGAGAAGLMAAIAAARHDAQRRVVALDGARTLGAKILVAGGGRCNVTHHHVDESAYAGSSRHAIKQVLRAFDAAATVRFFRELGVELKREETGKLFPVTDRARTVLDALLDECRRLGVELLHPWRVGRVERTPSQEHPFEVHEAPPRGDSSDAPPAPRAFVCRRLILATGGQALPRSGSDGQGYSIARALGHTTTQRIFPALVPLVLDASSFIRQLSGITLDCTLELRSGTGARLASFTGSTLLTHFGLSGPAPLDMSRYYLDERARDAGATLVISFVPGAAPAQLDAALTTLGKRPVRAFLRERLPDRLADALAAHAGVPDHATGATLSRELRKGLVRALTECAAPVAGDRGFTYAETTAGGVPLSELVLQSMESRACPGLHVIGEICDVDGRIGGFNFQWAWASGHLAGTAAACALGATAADRR
ncbi:MAG: aminoacetone oxidase family FAD-binding enzyme [Planctomycetota bacterium]|nr:aminoacetone oxidase family FAD-binding enzyme [Planctomycetota bacterium]